MARVFYTERDIEDLAKRGVKEIEVNSNVYITDLAREKMEVVGIKTKATPPTANTTLTAPVLTPPVPTRQTTDASGLTDSERQEVIQKVKSGVIARLGPGVDTAAIDAIVRRVVGQL